MKNKNISDFVAASMDAVLNSAQHKALFNTQYKFASDENDARTKKCKECGGKLDKHGKCDCDSSSAWDHHSAKSCHKCGKDKDACYCMPADDMDMDMDELPMPADDYDMSLDDNFGDAPVVSPGGHQITFPPDVIKVKSPSKPSTIQPTKPNKADDDFEMSSTAALDIAIDSLLTASAALDSVGMDNGSTLSLKLASLVVEAKKKMSPAEKKKLMERLQKGKKGKKPASSEKSSGKSSGSSSKSSSSSSSSDSSGKSSGNASSLKKRQ